LDRVPSKLCRGAITVASITGGSSIKLAGQDGFTATGTVTLTGADHAAAGFVDGSERTVSATTGTVVLMPSGNQNIGLADLADNNGNDLPLM